MKGKLSGKIYVENDKAKEKKKTKNERKGAKKKKKLVG